MKERVGGKPQYLVPSRALQWRTNCIETPNPVTSLSGQHQFSAVSLHACTIAIYHFSDETSLL